jgi:hypothetical protein
MPRVQVLIDAGISVRRAHAIAGTNAATVTAAGSDQSGATELTDDNSLITTATEGQGVKLPASFTAGDMYVVNGTSANVFVYPASGGKLNNAIANLPIDLPPQHGAIFKAISSTGDCLVIY